MSQITQWQLLQLNQATHAGVFEGFVHHASQFIAMTGQAYLPHKPDDSHTNLAWDPESQSLLGYELPTHSGIRLGLNILDFQFYFLDRQNQRIPLTSLNGKSRSSVHEELKTHLERGGLDGLSFKDIHHYQIPSEPLASAGYFQKGSETEVKTWTAFRTNAHLALAEVNQAFENVSTLRIWPHHFDSGIYLPLVKDTHGIGVGWAITDSVAGEPYFYVYGWKKDFEIDFSSLPPLSAGHWSTEGWKGAYLGATEAYAGATAAEQSGTVRQFLHESIAALQVGMGLEVS